MKKISVCLITMIMILSSTMVVFAAGKIYYPGVYTKKVKSTTYQFNVNEYSSTDSKRIGCFYIYKNGKKVKSRKTYEFYKVKKNVYRYKSGKRSLTMTIYKTKSKKVRMKVVQKGTILRGVKLSGIYKRVQKYPRP